MLVTTNFDRLFARAIAESELSIDYFQAPLSRLPKKRMSGLVYLHGLLSENPTCNELDDLVISSGDFGLAYLLEGWAARFVSGLFRNYTVCFVGYSTNDPVMRYMLDALAADKLLGESSPELFAFVDYSEENKEQCKKEWEVKPVNPVFYSEIDNHKFLHETLWAWANIYKDNQNSMYGKRKIVDTYAMRFPSESTSQDNFVGRMLWALRDPGGLPAKCFAEHDPVPSLDWLDEFCKVRYGLEDLDLFGIARSSVQGNHSDKLEFSLLRRPISSCDRGPRMALVGVGADNVALDKVMFYFCGWLARHLNDPKLLFWVASQGGCLHSKFRQAVEERLGEIATLERGGEHSKIERIRASAPNAIPSPGMRTYWRLALTGRLSHPGRFMDFHFWLRRFQRDGLTPAIRIQLREMLRPRVSLEKEFMAGTFLFSGDDRPSCAQETEEPARRIRPEIVLSVSDWNPGTVRHHIHNELSGDQRWKEVLPDVLEDMSMLLHDAMDLERELGVADDRSGQTYFRMPSISPHSQNEHFDEWTILIELCRDAWLEMAQKNRPAARLIAEHWWRTPYPVFKRLALFSAAQDDIIDTVMVSSWLADDGGWWLWSLETQREVMRILVALASRSEASNLVAIEQVILQGPPRKMYREDIQEEDWNEIVAHGIFVRLKRIGTALSEDSQAKLDELMDRHPDWSLEHDEKEEFPSWIGSASQIGPALHPTPRRRRELIEWLKQKPDRKPGGDWRRRCQVNFPTTAYALCALAKENVWPHGYWRAALSVWSEQDLAKRSWRYMAPVLVNAPDDLVQSVDYAISEWLKSVAAVFDEREELFIGLCRHVLDMNIQRENDKDEIDDVSDFPAQAINRPDFHMQAINHPIGKVTEALLRWWSRQALEDGQELSGELRDMFTKLCDLNVEKFRHGRVLLATRVITLFRVDRDWTEKHLLPLFDWQRSRSEACAAWQGFLWSPRPYRPLMEAIKPHFLTTAEHYDELDRWGAQYPAFLTIMALNQPDIFDKGEFAQATRSLPDSGLYKAADTLVQALKSVGEQQRGDYWENRMRPYLKYVWPQSRDRRTQNISRSFARLCVAAREKFPEAFKELCPWLQPLSYSMSAVKDLHTSGLSQKFPDLALDFLDKIVSDGFHDPRELRKCLESIRKADSNLADDPRFQRLNTICANAE